MADATPTPPPLIPYQSPPDRAPRIYDPLLSLAYHTEMKCVVCLDCRMVILSKQVRAHIVNADHRPKVGEVGEESFVIAEVKKDVEAYLENLVLDDKQIRRPMSGTAAVAYPWLEEPQKGFFCKICNDYAGQTKETMRKHLHMKAPCRSSRRDLDKTSNEKLMEECLVQRFGPGTRNPINSYFRVIPNVSAETGTWFRGVVSSRPDPLKNGAPLYTSDIRSKCLTYLPFQQRRNGQKLCMDIPGGRWSRALAYPLRTTSSSVVYSL